MDALVLEALQPTEAGWVLPPSVRDELSEGLERRARASEDAAAEVRPVLKIIATLRTKPGAAAGAEALVDVLRATPTLFDALVAHAGRYRNLDARLRRFEDRTARRTAPIHDAAPPQGSLPAHAILNGLGGRRR